MSSFLCTGTIHGEGPVSFFVAVAVLGEVQVSLFVAGTEAQVSIFVAGAVLGEVEISLFVAGTVLVMENNRSIKFYIFQ